MRFSVFLLIYLLYYEIINPGYIVVMADQKTFHVNHKIIMKNKIDRGMFCREITVNGNLFDINVFYETVWHITMVAITGTTIMVPSPAVKSQIGHP